MISEDGFGKEKLLHGNNDSQIESHKENIFWINVLLSLIIVW